MSRSQAISLPEAAWAGKRSRTFEFPADWSVKVYPMNGYEAKPLKREDILWSLRNPIGSRPLRKLAEGKKEVAIVFDDITRPTRVGEIAAFVLEELKASGIKDDNIRFISALGAHRAMNREEFTKKLGEEILERYAVYNHNPFHDYEPLGETSYGTPVEVNGEYASSDLRIGIGCIVPHPMMGFGGGAKIILPGIASLNAIERNHADLGGYVKGSTPHPTTGWDKNEGNVLRLDSEEFARISGLHLKIDVLVNGYNESIGIFSGDVVEEQRKGVEEGRRVYSSPMPENYDAVVLNTSAKANEASLAISSWYPLLKEGTVAVLVANPPEGQITHYAYGKFGKNRVGTIFNPPQPLEKLKRLIIYSEYPEVDPQLPIARKEDMTWIKDWNEVLEVVEAEVGKRDVRVAVIPNAEIQRPHLSNKL